MPYLRSTLESIGRQTWRNHRIIAWDNGSSDGSIEELRQWIPARIPGIVITGWPLPLGDCTGTMVGMARTELIAHTDQDDISLPHRLENQIAFLDKHPEVGFLGSTVEYIDDQDRLLTGWKPLQDDASLRWMARWRSPFVHSSMMLRRSAVLAAGNFRVTAGVAWDDADMWMRGSLVSEFHNLQTDLVQYRRHSRQTTHAIEDFKPVTRAFAHANQAVLFPGAPNGKVMALWEATDPGDESTKVALWHLRALTRAAVGLADRVGKPRTYFTASQFFRNQKYWLRRRFLAGAGLRILLDRYDSIRGKPPVNQPGNSTCADDKTSHPPGCGPVSPG